MAHQVHPSLAVAAQQRRVSGYKTDASQTGQHANKPSMNALSEAEMAQKGIQYWEDRKEFDHPSVEWWQLKSAKDFETGMGQKMFRGGTLSRWTDAEVQALQKEMEKTLASVGKAAHVKVATSTTAPVVGTGDVVSVPDDVLLNENLNSQDEEQEQEQEQGQGPVRLESVLDLDVYIAKKAEAEKQQKAKGSDQRNAFQALVDEQRTKESKDGDGKEEKEESEKDQSIQHKRNMHQRTRTEALRIKLEDMSKKLEQVHNDLDGEREDNQRKLDEMQMLETEAARNRRRVGNNEKLKQELLQLQGALNSAQSELLAAESQLQEKDQEILNLRRELQITKELNNTLSVKALSGTTLTPEDLLNQRIDDANRFALMVSAMQEQLEFERNQFVFRIHQLELQLEHKDVQINTLYELYNKLVESAQPKKGWFERLRDSVSQVSG